MSRKLLTSCVMLFLCTFIYGQEPGPFFARDSAPLLSELTRANGDTNKVQLLLKLSNQYLRRIGELRTDLDSSLYFARSAEKLSSALQYHTGIATSYLLLSWIYTELRQFNMGKYYAIETIRSAAKYKNYSLSGEGYFALQGHYPLSQVGLQERIKLVNQSLLSFRKANYKLKEGHVLKELGDLYMLQGDYGQSLATLKNALKIYKEINYKSLMGVYDLLGRVYTNLGDSRQGINYGLMALQNAKAVGDTTLQLCTFYNRVGLTYEDMIEYEKAYFYLRASLKIALKYQDTESIHEVTANAASVLNKLGRPKDAVKLLDETLQRYPIVRNREFLDVAPVYITSLKNIHRYREAKYYCNNLLDLVARSEPDDEVLTKIYATIIPFYLDVGDNYQAAKFISLHKQLTLKLKSKIDEGDNFLWKSRLDSSRANYLASISNYRSYTHIKDSLFNATKLKQLNQIEVIYDIERKDENIEILTKQSQLQDGLIREASLVQKVSLLSTVLLLGIVGLLYYGFVTSKKHSNNLQAKQDEINAKNLNLGRLLSEKEWLIKEIHHRVKNNLHMIVGLLESQSEFLQTSEAKMAISESQHRIQSMSMIHQKLYQSDNLSSYDFSAYAAEMVEYLKDSFNIGQSIKFELDIKSIDMNISHLVPIGLILNEVITNSIKYAFPRGRSGVISVKFKQMDAKHFLLTIADNGIGIKKEDLDLIKINSFGLTLIRGLCSDIDGHLEIRREHGTVVEIKFIYEPQDGQDNFSF